MVNKDVTFEDLGAMVSPIDQLGLDSTVDQAEEELAGAQIAAVKERLSAGNAIALFAKELYETYCASSDWKNFRGEPCPPWEDMPEIIQTHWKAVAARAARKYRRA